MSDDVQAGLRRRFQTRCREDLSEVRAWRAGREVSADARMATIVHRMAGVAGSFGFHDLSRFASAIDDRLTLGLAPDPEDLAGFQAALRRAACPPAGPQAARPE